MDARENPIYPYYVRYRPFKKVNDTYGHLVGDEVLKFLTKEMVGMFTSEDLCFRYGGEEFGILVKNKSESEAYEKLRTIIEKTISPTGESIKISLGITVYQHTDEHPKTILNRADTALKPMVERS